MTYYDLFGISKTATSDEIRRAFHRKALAVHPDRNPDDPKAEDKFKELAKAYDILSDQKTRGQYDEWLRDPAKFDAKHRRAAGRPGARSAPPPPTRPWRAPEEVWKEAFRQTFGREWSATFETGKMEPGRAYSVRPDPSLGPVRVMRGGPALGGRPVVQRPGGMGSVPVVQQWVPRDKKGKKRRSR